MIQLPPLPYADNALEPFVTSRTIGFHYGKHHKTYVDKANSLIEKTELADASVEEIIRKTAGQADKVGVFNNAAQVWNHTFYWKSMKPKGGGKPTGKIAEKIEATFKGFDNFKKEFSDAALTQFGSGWAWLVLDKGVLKIVKTPNAETPLVKGQVPLITVDVWEHAYYLDYQNRRNDYALAFLDSLVNWDFANENLAKG